MRLSSRPVRSGSTDHRLFDPGPALVRGRHSSVDDAREFPAHGVGVRGSGRQAQVSRHPRTTHHARDHFRALWTVRVYHWRAEKHSNASAFRRFPLHGYIFAQRLSGWHCSFVCRVQFNTNISFAITTSISDVRPNADSVHACKVPTGPYVFAPSSNWTCPSFHIDSTRLLRDALVSQIVQTDFNCIPCHGQLSCARLVSIAP